MVVTPDALIKQGYQARGQQRLAEARHRFAEAVDLCRKGDDEILLAQALTGLGQIESDLHRLDAALQYYTEAVDLYRTLDNPLVLAHTVRHVADILRHQSQFDLAATHYEEALAIYRSQKQTPPLDLANAIRGYALLKANTGNAAVAKQLWQEAGRLYAAVDVQAGVAEADRQIAHLAVG